MLTMTCQKETTVVHLSTLMYRVKHAPARDRLDCRTISLKLLHVPLGRRCLDDLDRLTARGELYEGSEILVLETNAVLGRTPALPRSQRIRIGRGDAASSAVDSYPDVPGNIVDRYEPASLALPIVARGEGLRRIFGSGFAST